MCGSNSFRLAKSRPMSAPCPPPETDPMPTEKIPALIERISRHPYLGAPPAGLNRAQWCALRFFAAASPETATSTAFSRHHATTKGTASQTILALIRKGLLSRTPMPGDGRSQSIAVTDEGLALLEQDPLSLLVSCLESLEQGVQQSLVDHLTLLDEALCEATDTAPLTWQDPALQCAVDEIGQAELDALDGRDLGHSSASAVPPKGTARGNSNGRSEPGA